MQLISIPATLIVKAECLFIILGTYPLMAFKLWAVVIMNLIYIKHSADHYDINLLYTLLY